MSRSARTKPALGSSTSTVMKAKHLGVSGKMITEAFRRLTPLEPLVVDATCITEVSSLLRKVSLAFMLTPEELAVTPSSRLVWWEGGVIHSKTVDPRFLYSPPSRNT